MKFKPLLFISLVYISSYAYIPEQTVTFYGATPNNNSDDDFLAFSQWASYINNQHLEGIIPAGSYKFSNTGATRGIIISNNAPIQGNNSIILMGQTGNTTEAGNIISVNNSNGTVINNLTLDGEYISSGFPQYNLHLIQFNNCQLSGLNNCTLKNSKGRGASFSLCENPTVYNCVFENNGDYMYEPPTGIDCQDGRSHSLCFGRCVNIVCKNSSFKKAAQAGVQFWQEDTGTFKEGIGQIDNCTFEDCAYWGIVVENFNGIANISNININNTMTRTNNIFNYGGIQVAGTKKWDISNVNTNNVYESFTNSNTFHNAENGSIKNCNFQAIDPSFGLLFIANYSNTKCYYIIDDVKCGNVWLDNFSSDFNVQNTMKMSINKLFVSNYLRMYSPPFNQTSLTSCGYVDYSISNSIINHLYMEARGCQFTTWHIEFENVKYSNLSRPNPQLGGYDIINKDNLIISQVFDLSNSTKDAFPFNNSIYENQPWRANAKYDNVEDAVALDNINKSNIYNRSIALENGYKYWIEILAKAKDASQQEIGLGCNAGDMVDAPSTEYMWVKLLSNKWLNISSPAELNIGTPTWLTTTGSISWYIKGIKIYKVFSSEIPSSEKISTIERKNYANRVTQLYTYDTN
jgi:hypothetical protein